MAVFLSNAVNNIIHRLRCSSKEKEREVFFPNPSIKEKELRIDSKESIGDWLRRIVNADDLDSYTLADNIFLIGTVKWERGKLSFVNLQALATRNGSIKDYYLDESSIQVQAQYFRLELDLTKPGPMFKEPLPHIHTIPDGEPRFPFLIGHQQTCIMDFLEFLFLNYQYDEWKTWAKNTWCKHRLMPDTEGLFDTVSHVFNSEKMEWLEKRYQDIILDLKSCLHKEKASVANSFASLPETAQLLNYYWPIA